ncbi:hypothetical protein [Bacillus sp. MRMR6]|uniref:hypothetical protein n=1 Tax=Bacillus sp. MRMR6 TaxID=1928617 RepID=UPI00158D0AE4|nr:hypothetical protein [Bacillus sp. MRMR6]
MSTHKLKFFMVLFLAMNAFMTGCSGSDILLDDEEKEVSFENQVQPSLIFFFTGVG